MKLETENLTLKPLSLEETEDNYPNWFNDPEVCKYNSHGEVVYTKEMAINFVNSIKDDSSKIVLAVYLKRKNIHIGNISLQKIDKKNKSAEIAYIFGEKEYWGKGLATEASQPLIDYAFKVLDLHRLYFGTHVDNIGMQKVGEKLGFKKEGVLKDAQYKNGKYNDVVIYGVIK